MEERNLFSLKALGEGLLTLWVNRWRRMWGCKPSCSPIRATRGKKGASTRVSQKTLRSSVDDDQVTGNEPLRCCITFRDGSLDPCRTGFCTLGVTYSFQCHGTSNRKPLNSVKDSESKLDLCCGRCPVCRFIGSTTFRRVGGIQLCCTCWICD